jgi:hypothetical protein
MTEQTEHDARTALEDFRKRTADRRLRERASADRRRRIAQAGPTSYLAVEYHGEDQ